MKRVALFGLGSMGFGMATSLVRVGHQVWGLDTNAERVGAFREAGGQTTNLDPATLDAVVVVVLNDAQTEAVLFGESGIARELSKGTVILACATIPPARAREFAQRAAEHGLHYLDAPISGGAVKSAEGALTIMASGTPDAFAAASDILEATSQTVFRLGNEAGAGSAMKAVNQLLAGAHIATMAEAITFAMTQGITPEQFIDVIPSCAGTSWMLENRAPHIVEGDYSPKSAVAIWPKDLGIVKAAAEAAGHPTPITDAALQQYAKAVKAGLAQEDDAAVAKVYAQATGIKLPD